mgnify:CR=1 FL=1
MDYINVNTVNITNQYNKNGTIQQAKNNKDDFLKILVSQLQNQDPLNPVNDTDFIAQMTQFSIAEEVTKINSNFLKAVSLTGKEVYAKMTGEYLTEYVQGMVEKVFFENGQVFALIDQKQVKISDILEVLYNNTNQEEDNIL